MQPARLWLTHGHARAVHQRGAGETRTAGRREDRRASGTLHSTAPGCHCYSAPTLPVVCHARRRRATGVTLRRTDRTRPAPLLAESTRARPSRGRAAAVIDRTNRPEVRQASEQRQSVSQSRAVAPMSERTGTAVQAALPSHSTRAVQGVAEGGGGGGWQRGWRKGWRRGWRRGYPQCDCEVVLRLIEPLRCRRLVPAGRQT